MSATKFHTDVEALRDKIEKAREELDWINTSPIPKTDLKVAVSAWTEAAAQEHGTDLALMQFSAPDARDRLNAGQEFLRLEGSVAFPGSDIAQVLPINLKLGNTLAWLLGDELVQRLHTRIDALDYVPGPALAERPKLMKAAAKELEKLERDEEAVILQAEEADVWIPRREDASPAVVLDYNPRGEMPEHHRPRAGTPTPPGMVDRGAAAAALWGPPGGHHAAPAAAGAQASRGMPAPSMSSQQPSAPVRSAIRQARRSR